MVKLLKCLIVRHWGYVICRNYIDYNLILLIFKGDVLINFDPPCPHMSHCGDLLPPPVGTSLVDAPKAQCLPTDKLSILNDI